MDECSETRDDYRDRRQHHPVPQLHRRASATRAVRR
jgi:hypothetical protein